MNLINVIFGFIQISMIYCGTLPYGDTTSTVVQLSVGSPSGSISDTASDSSFISKQSLEVSDDAFMCTDWAYVYDFSAVILFLFVYNKTNVWKFLLHHQCVICILPDSLCVKRI